MIPPRDSRTAGAFPFVTLSLILANCIVLLCAPSLGSRHVRFVYRFGLVPYEVTRGRQVEFARRELTRDPLSGRIQLTVETTEKSFPGWWAAFKGAYLPVFSSMFVHANVLHLALTLLFLWLFGKYLEGRLGHAKFLWFYILCGGVASACHIIAGPSSMAPVIGASGAVSGVLGACLLLDPVARIIQPLPFMYFVRIGAVPAFVLVGLWFALLLAYSAAGASIAWSSHIGGFIAGAVLVLLFRPRRGPRRGMHLY